MIRFVVAGTALTAVAALTYQPLLHATGLAPADSVSDLDVLGASSQNLGGEDGYGAWARLGDLDAARTIADLLDDDTFERPDSVPGYTGYTRGWPTGVYASDRWSGAAVSTDQILASPLVQPEDDDATAAVHLEITPTVTGGPLLGVGAVASDADARTLVTVGGPSRADAIEQVSDSDGAAIGYLTLSRPPANRTEAALVTEASPAARALFAQSPRFSEMAATLRTIAPHLGAYAPPVGSQAPGASGPYSPDAEIVNLLASGAAVAAPLLGPSGWFAFDATETLRLTATGSVLATLAHAVPPGSLPLAAGFVQQFDVDPSGQQTPRRAPDAVPSALAVQRPDGGASILLALPAEARRTRAVPVTIDVPVGEGRVRLTASVSPGAVTAVVVPALSADDPSLSDVPGSVRTAERSGN